MDFKPSGIFCFLQNKTQMLFFSELKVLLLGGLLLQSNVVYIWDVTFHIHPTSNRQHHFS